MTYDTVLQQRAAFLWSHAASRYHETERALDLLRRLQVRCSCGSRGCASLSALVTGQMAISAYWAAADRDAR